MCNSRSKTHARHQSDNTESEWKRSRRNINDDIKQQLKTSPAGVRQLVNGLTVDEADLTLHTRATHGPASCRPPLCAAELWPEAAPCHRLSSVRHQITRTRHVIINVNTTRPSTNTRPCTDRHLFTASSAGWLQITK